MDILQVIYCSNIQEICFFGLNKNQELFTLLGLNLLTLINSIWGRTVLKHHHQLLT